MNDRIWKKWWWVGAFLLIAGTIYIPAMNQKRIKVHELTLRLKEMENEKHLALQEKEDLRLQIASQSDTGWIEMVLMRDLGLVPEGWLKVHFKKQ